jgi:hypothetical protein
MNNESDPNMGTKAYYIHEIWHLVIDFKAQFSMQCKMDVSAILFLVEKAATHSLGVVKQFLIHLLRDRAWISPLNLNSEFKRLFIEENGANLTLMGEVVELCWNHFFL